jgi:hypothetical protein
MMAVTGQYDVAQGSTPDLGWHAFCFAAGSSGYPEGGTQHIWPSAGPNANGQYDWLASSQVGSMFGNTNADVDFWVTCIN